MSREDRLIMVPTEAIVGNVDVTMPPLPPVDIFVASGSGFALIRKSEQPYSALALAAHRAVWIRESDLPRLMMAFPAETRARIAREAAIHVVDDLFKNPSSANIDRGVKIVGSFVYLLMKDPNAYFLLAQLSSHDPYTLQHSVGTAVNCIILARKIGITDEKALNEVGQAGLFHDIGKTKISKEIINKNGPLDENEWAEMRKHSVEGFNVVREHPALSERTKRAIQEHHVDKRGTGYPPGLKWEEMDLFSRIVSICDVYNALTTDRSYSKARKPFEAFQLMRDQLMYKIDESLFRELVLIYGGKVD